MTITSHREVECKWRISEADLNRSQDVFNRLAGTPTLLRQSNRFFDSEDGRLRSQKMSLRLRLENHRLLLTCKRRVAIRLGALHQQQEEECWLNSCLWPLLRDAPVLASGSVPIPLLAAQALGGAPLLNMGGFDNLRWQWHLGKDVCCIDRTDFPGGQGGHQRDYEIEIELSGERDQAWWRNTLNQAGLNIEDQPETKLHRYLRLRSG